MKSVTCLTKLMFLVYALLLSTLNPVSPSSTQPQKKTNLADQLCKNSPNYHLCLSTLSKDPRTPKADVSGLGLIIVDAIKAKVTNTMKSINKLKGSNPNLRKALNGCGQGYWGVLIADIPEAVEALTKGDPKFAEDGMNDCANAAKLCEDGLGHNSPLASENKVNHDLSLVAVSIIRTLL